MAREEDDMASNRSEGLLWTLIGPAIWMALLLSVVSGKADGAVDHDQRETTATSRLETAAAQVSMSLAPLIRPIPVGCHETVENAGA
jgi:hypothetical protein